ncbi:alpha-amylase family glycosyl hydrolase [Streptacidiphilus jiangxiensis]|uniref:Pullulanase n=1 Tax=Streptacidiphilus jiangxiensis TaxID=235985 RepID=A0A1H7QV06_STRJI|nr:alpha-amylase family glycosyl hydrolase [Streptacidiphilus jiangxiensis]SEL51709.1 pullulanase [Streptacidiphilus jiangxiensis]
MRPTVTRAATLAATLALLGGGAMSRPAPARAAAPTQVSLPGTFDTAIGCSGTWQPACSQAEMTLAADGRWKASLNLPAGTWSYKIALNNSWTVNYGAGGAPGGTNITITVPTGGEQVSFVYDPDTHVVTDSSAMPVVTSTGDWQTSAGCTTTWSATCANTTMTDPNGTGVSTWSTTAIPAGSWNTKVTLGQSWNTNYGAGGAANGANIPFTVPADGDTTTFSYNEATHLETVVSNAGPTAPLNTLGALYTSSATTFRLWSPDSSNVTVSIGGTSYPMSATTLPGYSGVYQAVVSGNLLDQDYQFAVNGVAVPDPYAQMVVPNTTQGVVVDTAAVTPTDGAWDPRPALVNRTDAVVYELSVHDYTVDPSSGVDAAKRGKFLGLVENGTTYDGVSTGIDHLKQLGVTAVQIMPSFDFGSTVPNWGYDPVDYNVPEEQYSQFTAPEDRIREFKDMVNAFHKNGIRVIMDVVYNHTYTKSVFGNITGKYYTATDLSGTGDSIDDGNPMVSQMIQDSLEHWVRDYNVDGFRFDLAGVHYYDNVYQWANYLQTTYADRDLMMYGEPWNGGASDPNEPQKVRYGNMPALSPVHFGAFNGVYRDAIRGGTNDNVLGYMGNNGNPSAIAFGMTGSPTDADSTATVSNLWTPAFAVNPEQTMNYASIHDNLNLYDKITYSGAAGGATGAAGAIDKLAVGTILTSQGVPIIAEGDEFLRSKVVNGDYATAMNSYDAPDTVNAIHWGDMITNASVVSYYRDAIALRKATASLRLTTWSAVKNQIATQVSGSVVVAEISSNPAAPTTYDTVVVVNPTAGAYNVTLPAGTWTKVLNAGGATSATGNSCDPQAVTVFTTG